MQDAKESSEQVHFLRHSFSPSEQLQASLEAFTQPGLLRPRFLIKTLSGIALNKVSVANYHYDNAFKSANENFERHHNQPLQLGNNLAARRVGDGALKILMASENHQALMRLVKETRDNFSNELILSDNEDERFDLYVQIERQHARRQDQIIQPGIDLKSQLSGNARQLLYVNPEKLLGVNETRTIIRTPIAEEQAS